MLEETEVYITMKDHKSEFPNKIPCPSINSSKSSIGKISKIILDRINEKNNLISNNELMEKYIDSSQML